MSYRYLLSLLGAALIAMGAARRDWLIGTAWLGLNFLALGIAHGRGSPTVFGKRFDGTISPSRRVAFLPLFAFTTVVWHVARVLSREPAQNAVRDDLVVGRRLLASEVDGEFTNYVDLAAEFAEPGPIRQSPSYSSFPILDGSAPAPEELRAAVCGLRPGRTYIHCAQGHGRTGLFALAVLHARGSVGTVEEGLAILRAARPGIRLNRRQMSCARQYFDMERRRDACFTE